MKEKEILVNWEKNFLVTENGGLYRFTDLERDRIHTYMIYDPQGFLETIKLTYPKWTKSYFKRQKIKHT